ncbi:hypothetical protein QAD02_000416 [Eretmocerus hayati]|uniref:Uncharacterized protein n=1 Tax=Eretmocerus hayati TaxID=131215 RepID=A0ACC2NDJ5_9HYME|nr:hypothetical protein QAD02_000416 [Eretmocerus hayati]
MMSLVKKSQEQNRRLSALVADFEDENIDQSQGSKSNCEVVETGSSYSVTLMPTDNVWTGSKIEVDWGKKYNDAVTVRKSYHKRNAALKEQRDELLQSLVRSRQRYEQVSITYPGHALFCMR